MLEHLDHLPKYVCICNTINWIGLHGTNKTYWHMSSTMFYPKAQSSMHTKVLSN